MVVRTDKPFAEEEWLGQPVQIGDAEAAFDRVLVRRMMVGMAQHDLPESGDVLKHIGQREGNPLCLAIGGQVTRPGMLRVGDSVLTPLS